MTLLHWGDDTSALPTMQKWTTGGKEGILKLTFTAEENTDNVPHKVMANRGLAMNQIVNAISISRKEVESVLHCELGKTKVCMRWVSHVTPDQKLTRTITSRENLTTGFLDCLLTHDECWLYRLETIQTMKTPLLTCHTAGKVMASGSAGCKMYGVY